MTPHKIIFRLNFPKRPTVGSNDFSHSENINTRKFQRYKPKLWLVGKVIDRATIFLSRWVGRPRNCQNLKNYENGVFDPFSLNKNLGKNLKMIVIYFFTIKYYLFTYKTN